MFKRSRDNIHGAFGENLNINCVFEENEFIGNNFRPQNNIVFMQKKKKVFLQLIGAYRWFLKYVQMKWYGILNVLLNVLGL